MDYFVSLPWVKAGDQSRHDQIERAAAERHRRRSARRQRQGISLRAAPFHRQQGAQRRHAPARHRAGQKAERVGPVRNHAQEKEARGRRGGQAGSLPHGGGTFSPRSACNTSRRNCAKTWARSRRPRRTKFPRLVEWTQLRGTFHCHTNWSDGKNTLAEMAGEARELGLDYLGIADHSKSSFQANGLNEERLARADRADREATTRRIRDFHVFAGSEVDILKDGRLDFSDDVLAQARLRRRLGPQRR